MKLIKYPDTGQFRNVVATVNRMATFVGLDDNGDAILDETLPKPTLTFKGTIKLHGTNAGVSYNDESGIYTQSKGNTYSLDMTSSHMGFTSFVRTKEQLFLNTINHIKDKWGIDTSIYTITVYGEWVGTGVQKTVAISELPKSLYVFGIKISKPNDPNFDSYWLDASELRFPEMDNCWNIYEFETFEIEIDFNNPQLVQNKFVELINYVEDECPVAKHFGVSGIGEGIVWTGSYKGQTLIFKTKGEKHAGKSKVKTLKSVDEGRLAIVNEVVDKITPIWRLNQMFNEATNQGNDIDRKHLGTYIKMVIEDVMKEDHDIIVDAGLEPKEITKGVSNIARMYFFEQELV